MDPLQAGLPDWFTAGLALGGVLAGLVVAAFALGTRRFPDPELPPGGDGVEDRRRAEIRDYLTAIDEPFREDHRVGGRTVAFYLPDRGVAVTFDAKDYFVLERTGVRAVLVEGELPGAGIGARLPFETPEVEAVERPVANAFARLGLSTSADAAAVRTAYRERVKAAHPDHGGDPESFHELREAYTLARERAD